ncbi:DciA family protein [Streptomyces sp. NPDC002785]|uniref:DciA family protein n=1 Tax=Streptomyces sp. NPDC002785 TaxID=3154543 RepID=UPI00331FEC14
MSAGEVSGVDLARQALLAAREAAKKNGATRQKPKRRTGAAVRRDGREPLGLGSAIGIMMTERGMAAPAAGGSVLARWAAIAPEFAGHVAAVSYDADSGRLTVRPETTAWATKTRLEQTRLIAAANKTAGRTVVNFLRILPPGAAPVPAPADVTPAAPTGPAKTRETASEGYRRALAAHQEAARPSRVDPGIAKAAERQNQAMRGLNHRAFPDTDVVPADAPAPIGQARAQRRRQAAATEAAALRRARAERAAREAGTVAAVPQSTPLGRTA